MSTTSAESTTMTHSQPTVSAPRLRPEGAEQDALDKLDKENLAASNMSLDQVGCLGSCIPTDLRRRPISALAAQSFWNGVSEIKDVLTTSNPLLETSRFYVEETLEVKPELEPEADQFFEDINTLYERQTALFQRSCEQLKDLYQIIDDNHIDHQADANVSEFVLLDNKATKISDSASEDATISDDTTIEGTIGTLDDVSDEQKIFERSIRKSRIVFKSRTDILRAVTGRMVHFQTNAFGATDMVDVEDLYCEVIYCLLHMIGNDAPDESTHQLIEHLRKAFRVDPQKHLNLYDKAMTRDAPQLKLNLCVLEAKELACKDNLVADEATSRGDPFVTVSLKSKPFDIKNTTCKARTIHPVWNETFVIDLPENISDEILHVDVWNFMPDENLREKLKKINEVRDSKGLRQFIMDTWSGNGNGNNNKLIGSLEVPLCQVPASGLNKWWQIEKAEKGNKCRGLMHLLLHLSTNNQKRSTMAAQHRRLLRILLAHELLRNECKPFEWKDEFANEALHILAQHAVQGRMSRVDTAMSRWLVYAQTHALLPLDLRVFPPILERLRGYLQTCQVGPPSQNTSSSEDSFIEDNLFMNDINEFNMAADKFSAQCVLFIRKHRYYLGNNFDKYFAQLESLLKCLHVLHCLKWRTRGDIVVRVESAVISSVREWYKFVRNQFAKDLDRLGYNSESEDHHARADPTDRALSRKMRNLTKLTNLIIADIKTSMSTYRDLFRETLNVDYVELACKEYEKHLGPLAKNLVTSVCDRLIINQRRLKRRTRFQENHENIVIVPEFDLVIGTRLFELYLSLQEFYKLVDLTCNKNSNLNSTTMSSDGNTTLSSNSSSGNSSTTGDLGPYFSWFLKAVAKWLDIALFKAVQRILKAVELDNLSLTVDDMVMHTSSAVDIRTVFGQVRTFWTQLAWPDPETAYVFVSRILDDICKASVVYARKLVSKCDEGSRGLLREDIEVGFSREQCHVVNNLEFVLHAIRPLPQELGVNDILTKLEDIHGGLVSDACKKTINILVKNSVEILENQILEVLEQLSNQMAPKITKFLLEATPTDRSATPIKLLRFLDANLIFLKSYLVPENFSRVLASVWRISTLSLAKIIEKSISERRDVAYFGHLLHVFNVLLNFFYGDEVPVQKSGQLNVERTEKLLRLYSASQEDLILLYYSDRFEHQLGQQHPHGSELSVYPIGSINLRAILHETHLRVELLNARHLKPLETQKGQKVESSNKKANVGGSRTALAACLSAPDESLPHHESNYTTSETLTNAQSQMVKNENHINESSWKNVSLALEDIRSRFDSARQQLIEEAVAVSRSGGVTSSVMGVGSNGMCNPYVSIRLVPDIDGNRFQNRGLRKVKTSVKHRTLFPLFDETFDMVLPEGTEVSKTYLHFSVKDQSPVLGEGLLLGEALLPLSQIVKEDGDVSLRDVSQIQLGLSRPNEKRHSDLLNAMSARLTDAIYRDFLRKERRKMLL